MWLAIVLATYQDSTETQETSGFGHLATNWRHRKQGRLPRDSAEKTLQWRHSQGGQSGGKEGARSTRGSKRKALSRPVNGPAKCHRSAGATAVRPGTRQFSMEGSPGIDRAYEEHSSQLASIDEDSEQSPEEIQPATSTATLLFQTPGPTRSQGTTVQQNSCKWENETREVRLLDVSTAIHIAHMTARIARRKTACNQPAQTPASQPAEPLASQHTAEAQVVVASASKPAAQAVKMLAAPPAIEQPTPTSPQAHPAEGQPASIAASSVSDTTETLQSLLDLRNRKTQRQRATGASKGTGKIDRVTAEAAMEESKKAVTPCTTPINRVWTGEGKGRKLAGINILMPQADNLEEFRCDKAPCRHASKKFSTLAYLVHHLKCAFKNLNVRIMCSRCKEVASTCHMARKHKCPALQTGRQGRSLPRLQRSSYKAQNNSQELLQSGTRQPESSRNPPSRLHWHK